MVGIAERLPALTDKGAQRLRQAMASVAGKSVEADRAVLLARRDSLLAHAGARA